MIVVMGATGNVGRSLVELLLEAGEEVVALARKAPPGQPRKGLRYVQADVTQPETLASALRGASSVFVMNPPGVAALDAVAIRGALESARVPRVVLLSSQAVGTRLRATSHDALRTLENALRESSLGWTVLRAGGFDSNAFAWVPSVRSQALVAAPFVDVALPLVDPADIAAVAAVVLRNGEHASRIYELTGPALISPRQQAAALQAALGKPIQLVELSREQARTFMLQFMPPEIADGTLDILGQPTPEEQRISPDVARLLGRPASPFAAWLDRNLAAFRA